jgi:hypothetical protein
MGLLGRPGHDNATGPAVPILVLLAVLAAPASSGGAPPQGETVAAPKVVDRAAAARRRAELAELEALIETERERPSGTFSREVVDGKGHRLVLLVAPTAGPVERVFSFEPGIPVATLYALILDAERRIRLVLVEPMGKQEAYELDHLLFDQEGAIAARDHTYGTFTDCADGRLHERRIVTVFGLGLAVLERSVEFPNDPPSSGSQLTQGCALEAAAPPFADAAAFLRAHRLERAAREAGVRLARGVEAASPPAR